MNDEILDGDLHIHDADSIEIELLSGAKLLLLCVLTLNFYPLWWMYKKWRFFKENEGLDVMPAARALFAILLTYSLFEHIKTFAV